MLSASHTKQFEQAARAYANDLYRYLYWLCRDRARAEDLAQETFARAWAAWETQRDEKAVKAWLFTIARNEHARHYERKRLDIDPEAELEALVDGGIPDVALGIDLRKAFGLLPAAYRDPLLLQVLGGFTSAEIAVAMEATQESVNMRLSRARKALRSLIEGATPASRTRKSTP